MHLKLDSRSPVYVQVIDYFKRQIASGKLEMGEEIPSRRELANRLKINPNTVQRAYKEMEEKKLIHTDSNLPSKVTQDTEVVTEIRADLLEEALEEFVTSVKALDIPFQELLPLIEKKFGEEEST